MSACKCWGLVCQAASAMVLCGVASEAVAQSGFTPAPNQVSAGNIDVRLSRVYVRIGRLGWDHEHAAEGRLLAGNVQLGARDGAGELVFDAASFIADTQDARGQFNLPGTVHDGVREKVTQQIFSPAGLDADRFPQAVFRIRSSLPSGAPRADGGGEYQLEGELSLRGINRPLRIAVFVEPVNDLWRLRGEGKIKLSDFGMSLPKRNLRMPTETLTHGAETLAVEGDVWMRR